MIDHAVRERTACMMRVRNEARWIRRSLERTFQVAKTVVVWDDGSTDETANEAAWALGPSSGGTLAHGVAVYNSQDGQRALHYIESPFRKNVVRPKEAVNEIRDKNCLWAYCKSSVEFTFMLCLDGDETLSLEAIRAWPQAVEQMVAGVDIVHIPFIYLWDADNRRRVDGIYGDVPLVAPPYAKLNFPRLFTITRLTDAQLFDTCFMWFGTQGSMHCGSIPRQNFRPHGAESTSCLVRLPVVHMGYIDEELRQRKYAFYNSVDPGNQVEGEYKHIIGLPDVHAPGPLEFVPWEDV